MNPQIESFFDPVTFTATHVVYDEKGGHAAVIDPVLDYDPKSGRTQTQHADLILQFLQAHELTLSWILETHAHADHLTAAYYLRQHAGGKIAIGKHISQVQSVFKHLFHLEHLQAKAISLPGHTPADMAYLFFDETADAVFIGDTMFMPDVGTARCDFPGGDAHHLYASIQKLLALPPATRLFLCHDYPPNDRAPVLQTTVAEQKAYNIHVRDGVSEEEFVNMRKKRDSGLEMPVLLLPAIQINIRAGQFPEKEDNGVAYLKIPLNQL